MAEPAAHDWVLQQHVLSGSLDGCPEHGRGLVVRGAIFRAPVVGHVAHEQRADLARDGIEARIVPLARVRAATADQHLGPEVQRLLLQLVIVNVPRLRAQGFVRNSYQQNFTILISSMH